MKIVILILGLMGSAWWALDGSGRELHAWSGDGVRACYYADGQPESEAKYLGGLRHGPAMEWHPDGTQAARGSYEHGQRAGSWSFWRADGSLDRERSGEYAAGRRVGPPQESADS